MLIKLDDAVFDSEAVSSILPVPHTEKPVAGAAFDYRPETEVCLKTGRSFRTSKSVADVLQLIQDSVTPTGGLGVGYNLEAAAEDAVKALQATNEHLHTISEMITRYVLERPGL